MTTRTRRTPEQIAAYHQARANAARAKAAKAARRRAEKIRSIIATGMMERADGRHGGFKVGDYEGRLALYSFLSNALSDSDREILYAWASGD